MSTRKTVSGKWILHFATGLLLIVICQQAHASSFELHEQSTTYLGNAYAGTASTAEDASTGYYNPAGLPELKYNQAVGSVIYYHGNIKLYNASATYDGGTTPVSANSTTKAKSNAVIPGVHLSANINKKWSVGFAVVAPFGLNTRYSSTSIARYEATKSSIQTVDITPSVAFKINDQFSVGVGFDAMFVEAALYEAINFGTEGYIQNNGHAWTYGFHVGILFKPGCNTRMGLVYHSLFNPNIKGNVYTSGYSVGTAPTSLSAKLHMPDRLTYSITYDYSDAWAAMGDVEWTRWSRLDNLLVNYNTGATDNITLDNKDSWRVSLGANYKYNDCWKFKAGLAWDQSPVRQQYRIAALPDSDRYWIGVGIKYKMYKQLALDVAYAHLFFKKCTIQQVGFASQTLDGNYKNSADLVGVQLTWSFV